ncbi:MAG: hypothetical protein ACPIOQ_21365 [Promethearchaeia archaeon]
MCADAVLVGAKAISLRAHRIAVLRPVRQLGGAPPAAAPPADQIESEITAFFIELAGTTRIELSLLTDSREFQ